MKNFLASTLAVSLFAIAAHSAQAVPLNQGFNVLASLSSACQISSVAAPDLAFPAYTAFQATDSIVSSSITVECTRGLPAPVLSLDAVGTNVIVGLTYDILTSSVAAPGAAAAAGIPGTPDTHTITLDGTILAGQVGECLTATCSGTEARTLTITY